MKKSILTLAAVSLLTLPALGTPTGSPAITFHSDAYQEVGDDNLFSFLIGTTEDAEFTVVDGLGERNITITPADIDPSTGSWTGTWISLKAPASGIIKFYGDPSSIDVVIAEGAYVTSVEMPDLTNLDILDLSHNALQKLDLSSFSKLQAIYLTDNPFTTETPLKIGGNKPDLAILEIDIIDHLDQSFNLSDYPALVSFDGYHNMDLYNVDPTGCPNLQSLSVELTPCSSLDVSQNPLLMSLNVSESRITSIDISNNPLLRRFIGNHDSGTINTQYRLQSIDLSHNPNLELVNLNGNYLGSIDLSANPAITNLSLKRNGLTTLDLSANTALYSVNLMDNDMDFATLPAPRDTWGEYFYRQNPMPVARSIKEGSTIDLSAKVLRDGTQTIARVWRQVYDNEDELLDESLYSYADGKITFPEALSDSVYVEFANSLLIDYTLSTTHFMVKSESEYGEPTRVATFTPLTSTPISFSVGMAGATPQTPKTFLVDFGNGVRHEFEASSATSAPESPNVAGTPSGMVTIYMPENEVLTSLFINGIELASVDLSKATELAALSITDAGLYDIDLRYNRCLTDLDLSGNNLTTLDLQGIYGDYEKNVLSNIRAERNKLSAFNNIATRSTRILDLSDNQLDEFSLKDYDNLITLDLSANRLTEINLSYLTAATDIDLSSNALTSVVPCPTNVAAHFNIAENRLSYPSLPVPSEMGDGYIYAPQQQIPIASQSPTVNLSQYMATVEGNLTILVWKKADGTTLTEGADYTLGNGITTFLSEGLGEVYCELLNASFPQLSGDLALRTTATSVVGRPTNLVASFKTLDFQGEGEPNVIFAATEPLVLYIDWKGDGSELKGYNVETSYIAYTVDAIYPDADVKIYAVDAADAAKVNVFSIYNITLDDVDLTPLTGAYAISLGGTGLDASKVAMPVAPGLGELNFQNNEFTSFPYGEAYPNLNTLNLSDNAISSFDFQDIPGVGYVSLSSNNLTDLTINSDNVWSVFADNNRIETVDLSGAPKLNQLLLHSNCLSEIDIEPVKESLNVLSLVDNRFDFTSLPLPSDYPSLAVFYYGNQAPIEAECTNGQVDLSAQALIDGEETLYAWYADIQTYDPDSDSYVDTPLVEGTDYTIEGGVTTFLHQPDAKVYCLMTNATFPNLQLSTVLIDVETNAVEGIAADSSAVIEVYNVNGVLVAKGVAREAIRNLAPGIYVAGGRKIIVK